MRLAIPIFGSRISPVFDFSTKALIVEIRDGREINRYEIQLAGLLPLERVQRLKDAQVSTLICAGLSLPLQRMLFVAGLQVIPGIVGEADEVIDAYRGGGLDKRRFLMPGFCHRKRGRRNWGGRR